MATGGEHLFFAAESRSTPGTWVTPDKNIWVRSVGIGRTQGLMDGGETGGGRGARSGSRGEVGVAGPVVSLFRARYLPLLIRSAYGTRNKSSAQIGTGFRVALVPDDDFVFDTFSMQKRYKSTLAESIRGAKLGGFTISAAARQYATISMDWIAKDAAISGGFWADGTTSAPAVVSSLAYPATYIDGFTFSGAVMRLGGSAAVSAQTATLPAGEIVVTGGTARNDFDSITLGHAFNLSTDGYGVNLGDPTLQDVAEGGRGITIGFSPNFRQAGNEFYRAWAEGTPAIVECFFQGPLYDGTNRYQAKLTYPYVLYNAAPSPELNNSYGLKRQGVTGIAFVDPTLGVDHGIVFQGIEDFTL